MEPTWSYRFTLQAIAVTLVEAEMGDILSPKYAPLMTAPATIPMLAPIAEPTPIMTIPMVAMEPQDIPVKIEKMMGRSSDIV